MRFVITAVTDKGDYKRVNQDSCAAAVGRARGGDSAFAIVCDGVGSLERSEIASAYVVKRFTEWFDTKYAFIVDTANEDEFCSRLYEIWRTLVEEINTGVYSYAAEHGMKLGTTLSCVLVRNGYYYIMHIGDSRIYSLTDELRQLTGDHTLTEREIEKGNLTPEAAKTDKRRHVLMRCIGSQERVRGDFFTGKITAPAKLLVCSDGFRDKISEEQLYKMLYGSKTVKKEKITKGAEKVISHVRKNSEKDNITAAIIEICEE